jgi:hypothetical protein
MLVTAARLLNSGSCVTSAAGVTKLSNLRYMILVTLYVLLMLNKQTSAASVVLALAPWSTKIILVVVSPSNEPSKSSQPLFLINFAKVNAP